MTTATSTQLLSLGTEFTITITTAGCRRHRLDAAKYLSSIGVETPLVPYITPPHRIVVVTLQQQHLQVFARIRM